MPTSALESSAAVGWVVLSMALGDDVGLAEGSLESVGSIVGFPGVGDGMDDAVTEGWKVGSAEGAKVGKIDGAEEGGGIVGSIVGLPGVTVGDAVGALVGDAVVGDEVGALVGDAVGKAVGDTVGDTVGALVGDAEVGNFVGEIVGDFDVGGSVVGNFDGAAVGESVVGDLVGDLVGVGVGACVVIDTGAFEGRHLLDVQFEQQSSAQQKSPWLKCAYNAFLLTQVGSSKWQT